MTKLTEWDSKEIMLNISVYSSYTNTLWFNNKQDGQCMYNLTLLRVHITIVAIKTNNVFCDYF